MERPSQQSIRYIRTSLESMCPVERCLICQTQLSEAPKRITNLNTVCCMESFVLIHEEKDYTGRKVLASRHAIEA